MNLRAAAQRLVLNEDLNFLLTNRVPRIALTRFMGWWSRIRHPWVRDASMAVWKTFSDLDLSEAKKSHFDSLHDCFIRELKHGARTVDADPSVLASPCDAIVGECGAMQGTTLFQAKGFPYRLADLFADEAAAQAYADGCYVTLRLRSDMYHRFHAPHDGRIEPANRAKAMELLGPFVERNPQARVAREAYARLLVGAGQYEAARAQFLQLVQGDPKDADALYALALPLLACETVHGPTSFTLTPEEVERRIEADLGGIFEVFRGAEPRRPEVTLMPVSGRLQLGWNVTLPGAGAQNPGLFGQNGVSVGVSFASLPSAPGASSIAARTC